MPNILGNGEANTEVNSALGGIAEGIANYLNNSVKQQQQQQMMAYQQQLQSAQQNYELQKQTQVQNEMFQRQYSLETAREDAKYKNQVKLLQLTSPNLYEKDISGNLIPKFEQANYHPLGKAEVINEGQAEKTKASTIQQEQARLNLSNAIEASDKVNAIRNIITAHPEVLKDIVGYKSAQISGHLPLLNKNTIDLVNAVNELKNNTQSLSGMKRYNKDMVNNLFNGLDLLRVTPKSFMSNLDQIQSYYKTLGQQEVAETPGDISALKQQAAPLFMDNPTLSKPQKTISKNDYNELVKKSGKDKADKAIQKLGYTIQ